MSNTYTKGYVNGSALTESQLDTAYQSLQLDIANTALTTTGSTTGQALLSNGSGIAASFQNIPDPQGPFALRNYGLKATVATGVMTINLVTKALSTPSGSDKVDFNYSTNGTTSASYSSVLISSAVALSVNASATLGFSNTSTHRVFVYGYYNTSAAAIKLAVSSRSDLDCGASYAMTAISASADSLVALYATAALTVVPRLLGWIDAARNSGGSWQTPSKVNITNVSPGQRAVIISSSSGSWSNTSLTASAVTNLSAAIVTTGRPVSLALIPDGNTGSENVAYVGAATSGRSCAGELLIYRDSTLITQHFIATQVSGNGATQTLNVAVAPGSISFIDTPAAGSYTYSVKGKITSSATGTAPSVSVVRCKLLVYEL